jgi:tRNA pseudouridine synthase 10
VEGKPHWFVLDIEAQAGTYIKEWVHGDFGRTRPSVGELLGGAEVQIAELDVTQVLMDVF